MNDKEKMVMLAINWDAIKMNIGNWVLIVAIGGGGFAAITGTNPIVFVSALNPALWISAGGQIFGNGVRGVEPSVTEIEGKILEAAGQSEMVRIGGNRDNPPGFNEDGSR